MEIVKFFRRGVFGGVSRGLGRRAARGRRAQCLYLWLWRAPRPMPINMEGTPPLSGRALPNLINAVKMF